MNPLFKLLMISALVMPLSIQAFSPGQDNFASATLIPARGDAFSSITDLLPMTFETNEATHNPSNPTNHSSLNGGKSAWWKWTPTVSGFCTIDTDAALTYGYNGGSLMKDTVLSVYTGTAVNALTRIAANDIQGYYAQSSEEQLAKVTFYAVAGTQYFIAVDGAEPTHVSSYERYIVIRLLQREAVAQTRRGIWQIDSEDVNKHGFMTLSTTAAGGYSAVFQVGSKTYRFAGTLLADGTDRRIIARTVPPGSPPVTPISLYIDARGIGKIGVEIDGAETLETLPLQMVFPKTTPTAYAGSYNVANNQSFNNIPAARGYLRVTVSATGAVTVAGMTGDGTALTFSSALCDLFQSGGFGIPAFVSLHKGIGSYVFDGNVYEGNTHAADYVYASANYYRSAIPNAVYLPARISFYESLSGMRWVKPALNTRPYNFMNPNGAGQLTFFETPGEIASRIYESVTFSTAGKFIFDVSARKPTLNFSATTALVTGSIVTTDTILGITKARTRTIRSIIIKDYFGGAYLFGHASGTTAPVMVQITF